MNDELLFYLLMLIEESKLIIKKMRSIIVVRDVDKTVTYIKYLNIQREKLWIEVHLNMYDNI